MQLGPIIRTPAWRTVSWSLRSAAAPAGDDYESFDPGVDAPLDHPLDCGLRHHDHRQIHGIGYVTN
jgi:hypothetical protein